MESHSDKELIDMYRVPEARHYAFSLIVKKYQERIYWHVRKIVISHDDADDVVQNTFLKIWTGLDTFREDSKLFTWMYRIATNEALNFIKRNNKKILVPIDSTEQQLVHYLETDTYIDGDELQIKLQKAIISLPKKQKVVFNMKYFEDMKYEDMSEILGTSVGALKASFFHAVKKIEKYMADN